jgi:hypothetical protein
MKRETEYIKTEGNVHININYPEEFKELVENNDNINFIGTGNPNADILIIGKEMAMKMPKDNNKKYSNQLDASGEDQYEAEMTKNRSNWEANIHHTDAISIKAWNKCATLKWSNSNPLYPYFGQLPKKDKDHNNGTSPTWINYQKMIDFINSKDKSSVIDFHEYCFLSEFSTIAAPNGTYINNNKKKKLDRSNSIEERKELWKSQFMKGFPIVIVAAGHYPQQHNINIEELFDVSWINIKDYNIDLSDIISTTKEQSECVFNDKTIVIQEATAKNFINVHYNDITGRILIHTNQLSYAIYDSTFKAIAKIIGCLRKRNILK